MFWRYWYRDQLQLSTSRLWLIDYWFFGIKPQDDHFLGEIFGQDPLIAINLRQSRATFSSISLRDTNSA